MDKSNTLSYYKIFEPFNNLVAFTTTRQTFKILYPRFTGDTISIYNSNRELLSELLKLPKEQLVFPRQTHTNCVAEIYSVPEKEIKETDALITNQTNLCLCVQTADCVPVLIYDSKQQIIAAVHSGWRGTVNKIVEKTVQKMIQKYGSNPRNIYAAIGPSIGPNIYEVGNEVVDSVERNFPKSEKLLTKNNSGKFYFNLWEANKQLLQANQVPSYNIEILGECTFELAEKYFSARRDGIETGRMVTGIYMKA